MNIELLDLIKVSFDNNPNKHINNGNTFYINCEGIAFISKNKNSYYIFFTKGIFNLEAKEVGTLSTKQITKLFRILKERNDSKK